MNTRPKCASRRRRCWLGVAPRRVTSLMSGLTATLLIGCSAVPMAPGTAHAQAAQMADSDESQLLYELMVAEMAGRRGFLDVATEGYLRAAGRTTDVRVAERAAKLAIWGRQWASAEQAARRWLELAPDTREAQELLAQVVLQQGRIDDAVAEFAALIDSAEDADSTLAEVAALLLREPDMNRAAGVMRELQVRYPGRVAAQIGMARLALATNDRPAALAAVDAALAIAPDSTDALLLQAQLLTDEGTPAKALGALAEAVEANPDDLQLRLGYARLLVESGRYDEATPHLETAFEQAPDNATSLFTIGLLALDSKRLDAARRYLTALLETGEFTDQAHFYLARISDEQQDYPEAIEHYEAVRSDELFLTAHVRAAELHGQVGDVDTGLSRLHEIGNLLADPAQRPMLLTAEGRILQNAGRDEEALAVLSKGLEEHENNGELLYARALVAEKLGQRERVEQDLGQLIENEPNNAHALNALGYFLADAKLRLDEAESYLERANRLQPNDPAIMDSLGWLRFRQGRFDESITLLRQAFDLYPDAEIAAHLGEVLWVNGDQSAARDIWDRALAQDPDDELLNRVVKRFTE